MTPQTLAHLQNLCALLVEAKPCLRDRVRRAYDLLVSGGIRPCPFNDGDVLALSSDGVREYATGPNRCECKAFERGVLCLHRLSRRLFWIAQREEARQRKSRARSRRRGPMTSEEYVRSGLQLAGVLEHEAKINLAKKPTLSKQLGDHTRALHDRNATLVAQLPPTKIVSIHSKRGSR